MKKIQINERQARDILTLISVMSIHNHDILIGTLKQAGYIIETEMKVSDLNKTPTSISAQCPVCGRSECKDIAHLAKTEKEQEKNCANCGYEYSDTCTARYCDNLKSWIPKAEPKKEIEKNCKDCKYKQGSQVCKKGCDQAENENNCIFYEIDTPKKEIEKILATSFKENDFLNVVYKLNELIDVLNNHLRE